MQAHCCVLEPMEHTTGSNTRRSRPSSCRHPHTNQKEGGSPAPMHTSVPTITPLPLRVQPQPWEDLHSFLSRTATRMQYDKAAHIIQSERHPHHIASSHISLLTEQADYTFLSELLLLSQDTLYQMTLHHFSAPFEQVELFPVLKNPYKPTLYLQPRAPSYHAPIPQPRLAPGLRRSFFLPNQTTQICLLCLQENLAYDRLYWQSRYLLTCHKHAILLQRQCSTCHKRIPSQRMIPTSCPFCHHPYNNPSSTPVPIPLGPQPIFFTQIS